MTRPMNFAADADTTFNNLYVLVTKIIRRHSGLSSSIFTACGPRKPRSRIGDETRYGAGAAGALDRPVVRVRFLDCTDPIQKKYIKTGGTVTPRQVNVFGIILISSQMEDYPYEIVKGRLERPTLKCYCIYYTRERLV
ncbi:hypothetical protein EVAR_100569_1 [Eumeta japonica]|uniref:Uncharacterized protein n=1 Tax=Eumeta variegata TaxID=151549 RepID=A0A4C1YDZ8_EUMVA|nr:hypothetical protein EVAR_100569_1 [Eumeta japonica]